MLESRSCYHPNENPKVSKGWQVIAKVAYEPMQYPKGLDNPWNYQDMGCAGFSSKKKAVEWLKRSLADGYIPKTAVIDIIKNT